MPDGKPKAREASRPAGRQRRGAAGTRPGAPPEGSFLGPSAQADAVLESSPLGIVIVDHTGRIVRANGRLEQMFGYARGELPGVTLETLLPERIRAGHVQHRAGFFADPRVRPMGLGLDLMARRKDGREFPVEISLSFIEAEEGLLALGFVTDITPRRNAERRLQAEFLVTRVFAEPSGTEDLAPRLLQALCESLDWDLGELWRPDGEVLRYEVGWHRPETRHERVRRLQPRRRLATRDGAGRQGLGDGARTLDGDGPGRESPGRRWQRSSGSGPATRSRSSATRALTAVVVLLSRDVA